MSDTNGFVEADLPVAGIAAAAYAEPQVTIADSLSACNFLNPAGIDLPHDNNRDRQIAITDVLFARNNQTNFLTDLMPIDPFDGRTARSDGAFLSTPTMEADSPMGVRLDIAENAVAAEKKSAHDVAFKEAALEAMKACEAFPSGTAWLSDIGQYIANTVDQDNDDDDEFAVYLLGLL
jgi:hypothetical protein